MVIKKMTPIFIILFSMIGCMKNDYWGNRGDGADVYKDQAIVDSIDESCAYRPVLLKMQNNLPQSTNQGMVVKVAPDGRFWSLNLPDSLKVKGQQICVDYILDPGSFHLCADALTEPAIYVLGAIAN